jgi:hypothetical protein
MRIFLDANILFSAAKSDGAVRAMPCLLLEAGHERFDDYVLAEARRNLSAKGSGPWRRWKPLCARAFTSVRCVSVFPRPESCRPAGSFR